MTPIVLTGSNAVINMAAMINKAEDATDDVLGYLVTYNGTTYWSNFAAIIAYQTASYIWNAKYSYVWEDLSVNTAYYLTTEPPSTPAPTTEMPTTEMPATEVPTTYEPSAHEPTEMPATEVPTTYEPSTYTTAAPTTSAPEVSYYSYWQTNVKELSGLTIMNNVMYAVGDEGKLYMIDTPENSMKATTHMLANYGSSYDMEGITNDGTYLYVCCEGSQSICKIDPNTSSYTMTVIGNMYDEFADLAKEKDDDYDPSGNGLEGIAYYKNGILLVGNQDSPAGFGAFNINTGAAEGSVDKLAAKNYTITEAADVAVDGEHVYVLDSTNGLVIDVDLKITSKGNYKLENYLENDFDKTAHQHYLKVITNCEDENPEGLYIDSTYAWYCTDPEDDYSRIYRCFKF